MTKSRGRPKEFDESKAITLAMNYFWNNGYENTSLDNLLLEMGIKKSSFYHSFGSKEKLFSLCLDLYHRTMAEQLTALKNKIGPKQTMLEITQRTLVELQETGKIKGCLLVNSGQECYKKNNKLSSQIAHEFNFLQNLFVDFIREAQELGEISNNKSASKISGRYMNTLNGLVVTVQAGASTEMIDDIVQSLQEMLE